MFNSIYNILKGKQILLNNYTKSRYMMNILFNNMLNTIYTIKTQVKQRQLGCSTGVTQGHIEKPEKHRSYNVICSAHYRHISHG